MAQLIVRKLETEVVRKLKERAAKYGVSMEEETRRILRHALLPKKEKPKLNFKEFLVAPPYFDDDLVKLINDRRRDKPRPVNLE